MVFIHPNGSLIRLRMRWLTWWPTWRVMRRSMVLRWRVMVRCENVAREPGQHLEGGAALGKAGRLGELHIDDQRVAVLHEQIAGG